MPTRTEIIAQIDNVLFRLESARDFLTAALAESKTADKIRLRTKVPGKARKQAALVVAAAPAALAAEAPAVAPSVQAKTEPQIRRVPPKRRMERRQSERGGKSAAALSGLVPAGPVAVSAAEAHRVQERSVQPAAPAPVIENAAIGSERSLGSLIQAFERRAGLSGIEIP